MRVQRGRLRGLLIASAIGAAAFAVRAALASPWPAALAIRAVFTADARRTVAEMERHAPDALLHEQRDLPYPVAGFRAHHSTAFDLVRPDGADGPLPVVVWVHGGAWISGDKRDVLPYLRLLAARGYAAVGLNYTVAPGAEYPTAVRQLNSALAHLVAHAEELGIDPGRIVLAGDSAGAQIVGQLLAVTLDRQFAAPLRIVPALRRHQIAGAVLHCGVYDLDALSGLTGLLGWGLETALWATIGRKDWSGTVSASRMSVLRDPSFAADLPPVLISGGNGDGLTSLQSEPLAERLGAAGVDVTTAFWPGDHEPALPHEFQFHLDLPEARGLLERTVEFLDRVTAHPSAPAQAGPASTSDGL